MAETICLGGHLHGKRVHIISHPSETSDMLDEPDYSLRTLENASGGTPGMRRFYVFDDLSNEDATALAAQHWKDGQPADAD